MSTSISDNEAFWRDFADVLFPPGRVDRAAAEIDDLVTLLGLAPGAAVLDLPCGVGRHSIELAKRGYRVTGGDLCEAFLQRARSASATAQVEVEWLRADMREFQRPLAFDAAISLWTSFGYGETSADDANVLMRYFANLKPGGRLAMEMMGKENLAAQFRPREWSREDNGVILLQERAVLDNWSKVRTTWIALYPDGRRVEQMFTLNIYSASELVAMVRSVGFRDCKAFADYKGQPYDHTAKRLVVVATKWSAR